MRGEAHGNAAYGQAIRFEASEKSWVQATLAKCNLVSHDSSHLPATSKSNISQPRRQTASCLLSSWRRAWQLSAKLLDHSSRCQWAAWHGDTLLCRTWDLTRPKTPFSSVIRNWRLKQTHFQLNNPFKLAGDRRSMA